MLQRLVIKKVANIRLFHLYLYKCLNEDWELTFECFFVAFTNNFTEMDFCMHLLFFATGGNV